MTGETEAHAAMLRTVADHLTQHPHLSAVNILSDDRLQLRSPDSPGRELVAWADTLTDPAVNVHRIWIEDFEEHRAFVYVTGELDALSLDVWDTVPGLLDALDFGDNKHMAVSLDALRAFAETGEVPTPADDAADSGEPAAASA